MIFCNFYLLYKYALSLFIRKVQRKTHETSTVYIEISVHASTLLDCYIYTSKSIICIILYRACLRFVFKLFNKSLLFISMSLSRARKCACGPFVNRLHMGEFRCARKRELMCRIDELSLCGFDSLDHSLVSLSYKFLLFYLLYKILMTARVDATSRDETKRESERVEKKSSRTLQRSIFAHCQHNISYSITHIACMLTYCYCLFLLFSLARRRLNLYQLYFSFLIRVLYIKYFCCMCTHYTY